MLLAVFALGGCEELEARRLIQKADALYTEGKYQEAVKLYEEALIKKDLEVGQHNAALTYLKLFENADADTKAAYGKKAAEHFQAYLKVQPDDTKIIHLLTQTWIDSGQYKEALAYWESELAKDPKNRDVLNKLVAINRDAGNFDEAVRWSYRRADAEPETAGKVDALLQIGRLAGAELKKADLVDVDRIKVADIGIEALQRADSLQADNKQVHATLGNIFKLRALAHGASWAQLMDAASSRKHLTQYVELERKEREKATKPPDPAAGGDQPKKDG